MSSTQTTIGPPVVYQMDLALIFHQNNRPTADELHGALQDYGLRVRRWEPCRGVDDLDAPLLDEAHFRHIRQLVFLGGTRGLSDCQRRLLFVVLRQHSCDKGPLIIQVFRDARRSFALDKRSVWLNIDVLSVRGVARCIADLKSVQSVSIARRLLDHSQNTSVCPYPGFRAFREDEAALFFGRERETQQLLDKLLTHGIVVLESACGVGKTSLIRAGLIPALRVSEPKVTWHIAEMRPRGSAWRALAIALGALDHVSGVDLTELLHKHVDEQASVLRRNGAVAIVEMVNRLRIRSVEPCKVLLFVDRLGEAYQETTTDPRALIETLIGATRDSPDLKVVMTLDANWWGSFLNAAPNTDVFPDAAIMHLRRLGRDSLARAIEIPAQETGLRVDSDLVDRLCSNVLHRPDTLPLLQLTLRELWIIAQAAGIPILTQVDDKERKTFDKTAERRIRAIRDRLNSSERTELPDLFSKLLACNGGRFILTQHIALQGLSERQRNLAWTLLDEGLLEIIDLPELDDLGVRIGHDSLYQHSRSIRKWFGRCRDALRTACKLESAAANWFRRGVENDPIQPNLSHTEARDISERLRHLPRGHDLTEQAVCFLGPIDANAIIAETLETEASHRRRRFLGERLSVIGDPRPGVGCREGIPEIDWVMVPGGRMAINVRRTRLPGSKRISRIVAAFKIARYPITVRHYRAFIAADGGWNDPHWWDKDLVRDSEGSQIDLGRYDNHPAQFINWFDAMAFCRWLTETLHRTDQLPATSIVRLPNEWEWQQAATLGCPGNRYPWGAIWTKADSGHFANTAESQLGGATAVGMYPHGASPAGSVDMAGNVFEWCLNQYNAPFREESTTQDLDNRAVRGGSWFTPETEARCLNRRYDQPDGRFVDVGFRILCTFPQL